MIQRIQSLYLLLCCMLLTSCEDMYHKMIEYNGSTEDPVLCLNAEIIAGQQVKVYVTRSWFFLDQSRNTPYYSLQPRGIVSDATVEMQINDGEWFPLTFVHVNDTVINGTKQEGKSYYTCSEVFKSGDKVSVRANREGFEMASATEMVPEQPQFSVTQIDSMKNLVLKLTYDVSPVKANAEDVVFLWATVYVTRWYTGFMWKGINKDTTVFYYDTIVNKVSYLSKWNYSDDFMFSEYDLPRTSHGFYVQNGPLSTSADHFLEGRQVAILLDLYKYNKDSIAQQTDTLGTDSIARDERHTRRSTLTVHIDSIQVGMRLADKTFYWYRVTQAANLGSSVSRYDSYVPEISLFMGNDSIIDSNAYSEYDIFGMISEMFSELGAQEGYQIYTNINGGFGHFCFLNQSVMTIYPDLSLKVY